MTRQVRGIINKNLKREHREHRNPEKTAYRPRHPQGNRSHSGGFPGGYTCHG